MTNYPKCGICNVILFVTRLSCKRNVPYMEKREHKTNQPEREGLKIYRASKFKTTKAVIM